MFTPFTQGAVREVQLNCLKYRDREDREHVVYSLALLGTPCVRAVQ